MIKVVYNANPNVPQDCNHTRGRKYQCTEECFRLFETPEAALEFWLECIDPVTKLTDLPLKLDIKTLAELQLEYDQLRDLTPELLEENLVSQQPLYELMEEDI